MTRLEHLVLLSIVSVTGVFSISARASSLIPFTIEVPNGTTQHGNPRILCPPTTWITTATFFVGNFVAHIATVKSIPGERVPVTICNLLLALLFPTSGLMRGLNAIARCVRFGKSELDKACRAGALCVVVRNSQWRPRRGDTLQVIIATQDSTGPAQADNAAKDAAFKVYHPTWLKEDQRWWVYFDTIWGRLTVNTRLFDIHGTYRLPRGYSFAVLPRNSIVLPRIPKGLEHEDAHSDSSQLAYRQKSDIASSGSVLKILASIFQLSFSYYTVYRNQGDQIEHWGYVSLLFTPLPYAVMSFINGTSNLLAPDYPRLYMVHSEIMDEAQEADGAFDGVIGRVVPLIGPTDDDGYKSGFATTWKGLSPASIERFVTSVIRRIWRQPYGPRTLLPATATTPLQDVDNHDQIQIQPGRSSTSDIYKLISNSTSTHHTALFQNTSEGPSNIYSGARSSALTWNPLFLVVRGTYCCIMHPKPTIQTVKKWNEDPWMSKEINPHLFFFFLAGIILWSFIHPQRATRWLRAFKYRTAFDKFRTSDFFNALTRGTKASQPQKITLYYRSCSRFQRYDDPIAQKDLTTAITNPAHVIGVPVASDLTYPCTLSARETSDVSWTSILLPLLFWVILSAIPVIVVGFWSHFEPGSSTTMQRVVILLWWSSGTLIGLFTPLLDVSEILVCIIWLPNYIAESRQATFPESISPIPLLFLAVVPWSVFVAPIWGFVIVGQMLNEWGSCISLYEQQ